MRILLMLLMGLVLVVPMGCEKRDQRSSDQIKGSCADPDNAVKTLVNKAHAKKK